MFEVDGKWNHSKFIKIEKEKEENCKQFYQTKQTNQVSYDHRSYERNFSNCV